jgi:hypothetical protein
MTSRSSGSIWLVKENVFRKCVCDKIVDAHLKGMSFSSQRSYYAQTFSDNKRNRITTAAGSFLIILFHYSAAVVQILFTFINMKIS